MRQLVGSMETCQRDSLREVNTREAAQSRSTATARQTCHLFELVFILERGAPNGSLKIERLVSLDIHHPAGKNGG